MLSGSIRAASSAADTVSRRLSERDQIDRMSVHPLSLLFGVAPRADLSLQSMPTAVSRLARYPGLRMARPANSRVSVWTFTFSPSLMNSGTRISRPVSSVAVLGDAAAGGVAADARLGVGDGQLDVRRELQADRVAVVLLHLDQHVVDQQLAIVAERRRRRSVSVS